MVLLVMSNVALVVIATNYSLKKEYIDKFSGLYDFIPKWVENLENSRCLKPEYRTPERQTELLRRYRGAGFSNHVLKKDFLVHLGIWDKVKFKFSRL